MAISLGLFYLCDLLEKKLIHKIEIAMTCLTCQNCEQKLTYKFAHIKESVLCCT